MCLDIAFYSALQLIDNYFPDLTHDGEINFDLDMGMHFLALGHNRYPVIVLEDGRYYRKYFDCGIIAEYMDTPEKVKAMLGNVLPEGPGPLYARIHEGLPEGPAEEIPQSPPTATDSSPDSRVRAQ